MSIPRLPVYLKRDRLFIVKALLFLVISLLALPAYAENWTTNDGRIYQDVKVIRVEDDAITILFKDGGALVPIFKLPAALQKRFSYDPAKAKLAADVRAKADAENAKALQVEIEQADKLRKEQQIRDAQAADQAKAATRP